MPYLSHLPNRPGKCHTNRQIRIITNFKLLPRHMSIEKSYKYIYKIKKRHANLYEYSIIYNTKSYKYVYTTSINHLNYYISV